MEYYSIGDVAKLLNLTTSAIRYYDDSGLLPFVSRGQGGQRLFTEKDIDVLRTIIGLRQCGMKIEKIRQFVSICTDDAASLKQRIRLLTDYEDELIEQIRNIQDSLMLLRRTIRQMQETYDAENGVPEYPAGGNPLFRLF